MPGSILINDGRRSASPDRRVTFGNIERYDIMTSNEMKNMAQTRRRFDDVATVNGDYPMTRLDNRIRKAMLLGFSATPGDSVSYQEIVDFLMDFQIIVNPKLCNERQITALIQSSFPKCIVKPSAKHSLTFLNIENRSDEVIKEELVRVTTEPIINPFNETASLEAKEWIEEEQEEACETDEENEELSQIESRRMKNASTEENSDSRRNTPPPLQSDVISSSAAKLREKTNNVDYNVFNTQTNSYIYSDTERTKSTDPLNISQLANVNTLHEHSVEKDNNNTANKPLSSVMTATIRDLIAATSNQSQDILKNKKELQLRRSTPPPSPPSFNEHAIDVPDQKRLSTKTNETDGVESMLRTEEKVDKKAHPLVTIKRTNSITGGSLGRSRSVTDMAKKFEENVLDSPSKSSLQRKQSFTRSTDRSFVGTIRDRFRSKNKQNDGDKKSKEAKKKSKNEEVKAKSTPPTPSTSKTPSSSTTTNKKSKEHLTNGLSDFKETRNSTQRRSLQKSNLSSSHSDVRSSFRNKQTPQAEGRFTRSSSGSVHDVRSSHRITVNSTKTSTLRSATNHTIKQDENAASQSVERPNMQKVNSTNDVRSSFRRAPPERTSTFQYTRDTANKPNSLRGSYRLAVNSPRDPTSTSSTKAKAISSAMTTDSRKPQRSSSINSSSSNTPNISRENSRSSLRVPKRKATKVASPQEKDFVRIAKAFQKASKEIGLAHDNIEKFMIAVAIEDVEVALNERLKLDELYDHIRHRMILAKDTIFDGYPADVKLDMSQYFELLFKTLAANFERVGCEIVTNKVTREKVCYLMHLKLVDYADDLSKISSVCTVENNDVIEEGEASYV